MTRTQRTACAVAFVFAAASNAWAQVPSDEQALIAGAEWLMGQQFPTGAFPFHVGGPPRHDSMGTTARGLLAAHATTADGAYLLAAMRTGDYIVDAYPRRFPDGDPDFAPLDPLFLEELSLLSEDPRYSSFVRQHLWDKLQAGTYGAANDMNATSWAATLPVYPEYANWPALEPYYRASPAVAAHYAGEFGTRDALMASLLQKLEATKASKPTADLTGLATAIWASAHTGIDLDPKAGRWASRNSTQDLVNLLVGYQRAGGDWPYDTSSRAASHVGDTSVTSWAVTALKAWDPSTYATRIRNGLEFIKGVQQADGQILTNPGFAPETETGVAVHGEALVPIGTDDGALINDGNAPPVAVNDAANTVSGTPVTIPILANDTDSDGVLIPGSVLVVTSPSHGTAAPAANGDVTYTPAPGYSGADSFTYTVRDDDGATSNQATVSLSVLPANSPPVAVNDTASTSQSTAVAITVLANDSDPDGSLAPDSVQVVSAPSHGTALPAPDGTVTYTPAAGYLGGDSFTYTVRDNVGATSNVASVTLTVTPPPGPVVHVFAPTADTYTSQTQQSSNFGTSTQLQVRQQVGSYLVPYLKFSVSALAGPVTSARLRLYVVTGAAGGGTLWQASNTYRGSSTAWTETGLTWKNADTNGTALASVPSLVAGTWIEMDVTATVNAGGTYSFGFINGSGALVAFSSRQGTHPPELLVETQP